MLCRPTKYKGIRYRSQIEACWAAYMDLLNWDVVYEPEGFVGYIPDFIVRGEHELLIEVKHHRRESELEQYRSKIEQTWAGRYLIVGGRFDIQIGRYVEPIIPEHAEELWGKAIELTQWRPEPKQPVPIAQAAPSPVSYNSAHQMLRPKLSDFSPFAVGYQPPKP